MLTYLWQADRRSLINSRLIVRSLMGLLQADNPLTVLTIHTAEASLSWYGPCLPHFKSETHTQ
jgi:hypothetical protein